jgi:hypothetical protein
LFSPIKKLPDLGSLGFLGFLGVALAGSCATGTLAGEALIFGLKSNTPWKIHVGPQVPGFALKFKGGIDASS